jgi:hypothetical protein
LIFSLRELISHFSALNERKVVKMTRKAVDEAAMSNYEDQDEASSYTVSDGFSVSVPDLGANLDAPPAYGDDFNELQLSQAGFEAGAAVTGKLPGLFLDRDTS